MQIDETRKAISDIESRKKAITHASKSEQDSIIGQINEKYRKIGETAYTLHNKKEFEIEKIAAMIDEVKGLHDTLDEKKAKLLEIQSRYDEELTILKAATPKISDTSVVQNEPSGNATCSSCGAAYTPGEMLFCRKCGNKLSEPHSSSSAHNSTAVQPPTCPKCNAKLIPDAMFCNSCGNKL